MHYHQHEFINTYLKDAKSILILGDVRTDLPTAFSPKGSLASEYFKSKGYEVDVAGGEYEKSTYKPADTYDLIIDFHGLCKAQKSQAYIIFKNLQKAAHEDTVFIHFSPMPNHFPGMSRNSNLTLEFWGSILADDAILETRTQGAYHNNLTGQEVYIAHEKMKRFPAKKVFTEKIKPF